MQIVFTVIWDESFRFGNVVTVHALLVEREIFVWCTLLRQDQH